MPSNRFLLSILAGVLLVLSILPLYNTYVFQPEMASLLMRTAEQDAACTAQHFISRVFPEKIPLDSLPLGNKQAQTIHRFRRDYDILQIKILSPDAVILYSTNPQEIGKIANQTVSSELFSSGGLNSRLMTMAHAGVAGALNLHDVINVVMPVMDGRAFSGVVEFYFDITGKKKAIDQLSKNSTLVLVLVGLGTFVLFFIISLKMKKTVIRQVVTERELNDLSYNDQLTGLPNRNLLLDRLNQTLKRSSREEIRLALLYIGLDRFKDVNDSLGRHKGDQLLKIVAGRLSAIVRESDTLARAGGDEFVLLLSSTHKEEDASVVARNILELFTTPFSLEGREIFITPSIGVTLYPENAHDAATLLHRADTAMSSAKDRGRNTYAYFSAEMHAEVQQRLELENSLRNALAEQQFVLLFQPQTDLRSNKVTAAEVLLRWNHPEQGLVSPGQFIPLAEETGLIAPIGEWVLEEACRQSFAWQQRGYPPLRLAVNLSACQFKQANLFEKVDQLLQEYALPSHLLELELTESLVMDDAESAISSLSRFRARGIHLAIDDFGTGYSSLSYLRNFPVDRIKIDRSFVGQLPQDRHSVAIVEAILAMAKALDLQVVAEGVEDQAQLDFLKNRSCTMVQGFFLGRPLSAAEFTAAFLEPADQ